MPRVKTSHVARATCAVAVICLYFLYETPWSASKPVVWRGGGAADVLNHVNMFIGTINGGGLLNLHRVKAVTNIFTGHAFPGASLPYGEKKRIHSGVPLRTS